MGTALVECLGDRRVIRRYGHAIIPMDEALATVAVESDPRQPGIPSTKGTVTSK